MPFCVILSVSSDSFLFETTCNSICFSLNLHKIKVILFLLNGAKSAWRRRKNNTTTASIDTKKQKPIVVASRWTDEKTTDQAFFAMRFAWLLLLQARRAKCGPAAAGPVWQYTFIFIQPLLDSCVRQFSCVFSKQIVFETELLMRMVAVPFGFVYAINSEWCESWRLIRGRSRKNSDSIIDFITH